MSTGWYNVYFFRTRMVLCSALTCSDLICSALICSTSQISKRDDLRRLFRADPCPGINKMLRVRYETIPGRIHVAAKRYRGEADHRQFVALLLVASAELPLLVVGWQERNVAPMTVVIRCDLSLMVH